MKYYISLSQLFCYKSTKEFCALFFKFTGEQVARQLSHGRNWTNSLQEKQLTNGENEKKLVLKKEVDSFHENTIKPILMVT